MCGIVAAASQDNVVNILADGLKHLEYRGYDSAGIAIINPKTKNISELKIKNFLRIEDELLTKFIN